MSDDKKVLVTRWVGNPRCFSLPAIQITEWCRQSPDGAIYTHYEDKLEKVGMYVDRTGNQSGGRCPTCETTHLIVRKKANGEYVNDFCPRCNSGNWVVSESDIISILDEGEEDFSQWNFHPSPEFGVFRQADPERDLPQSGEVKVMGDLTHDEASALADEYTENSDRGYKFYSRQI